jgi:sulfate transport system ATP-binding protein
LTRNPGGDGALEAVVSHVRPNGTAVRVELRRSGDEAMIEAELPRHEFQALGIKPGDRVYLEPRRARVFRQ